MNESTKRKKVNSRWNGGAMRYNEARLVEDEQHGDTVTELTWLERRRAVKHGWRNGAKVKA